MNDLPQTDALLEIETFSIRGSELSFCPIRGGIIASLKLQAIELLYMDKETFDDPSRSVHGGIPILFPNAGAFSDPAFPLLKQHGFARNCTWSFEKTASGFVETLISDSKTHEAYPYDFKLSLEGIFQENGSFTLHQSVENCGDNVMPVSMGLHPYFKVKNEDKSKIKFNFEGGKRVEDSIESWANGTFVSIDNPKVKDPNAIIEVILPDIGTLVIEASMEYKKIWVWSEAGKDFICIEPVMRDPGGLVNNPYEVNPKEIFQATVTFSLKK